MTTLSIALTDLQQQEMRLWYQTLRDAICNAFEAIEHEYAEKCGGTPGKFERKEWTRAGGGGGVISLMRGQVFEKVGVNISTVYGTLSEVMRGQLPGTEETAEFWASGISLVAHMLSPLVPAVHMNTRTISTTKYWFGGGMDLTPAIENEEDAAFFHRILEECCARHSPEYYPKFKEACDHYFYLPHRQEPRGIGGIFYDYHHTNWEKDVQWTKDVGESFLAAFIPIVQAHVFKPWTPEQKQAQNIKRGRYVEFNLLHDRGTKFGFLTGGNPEAILMSMPPIAYWP